MRVTCEDGEKWADSLFIQETKSAGHGSASGSKETRVFDAFVSGTWQFPNHFFKGLETPWNKQEDSSLHRREHLNIPPTSGFTSDGLCQRLPRPLGKVLNDHAF